MTDSHQTWQMPKPVDYAPQRIVSLVPSVTESLFDLNLGSRVVGITDYCVRPAELVETLPRVGGTKNPDIEKIIALRPDLVIINDEENRQEDATALRSAGVSVWVTGPRTVAEAINLLWEIMEICDAPAMVPRVRLIEQKLDVTRLAMMNERPIKTFIPIWYDPWMTGNQHTYMHDVMSVFGLVNVFGERERQFPLEADLGQAEPLPPDDPRRQGRDTRYPRLSLEEIEAAQPELILLPDEPFIFNETHAAILGELDIPAAQMDNIYLVEGALLLWHGTHLTYAISQLPPMLAEVRARLAEWDATHDK
jgi:ABC-type Fe3+-hydroxamate transport system substrate-binding protein